MGEGIVVWMTGLPSSGKSALAARVAAELRRRQIVAVELDGDALRGCIVPAHGYGEQDRSDFYETLARMAALFAGQGAVVVVAATATRASFRARARELWPRFVEVFVDVPLATCIERDAKGLYASGSPDLPGLAIRYEPPADPEATVHGGGADDVVRVLQAIDALAARATDQPTGMRMTKTAP